MHLFEVMAEPIRRRLVDVLASGSHYTGDLECVIMNEFGVGRAAVHHHLKLLRDHGYVTVHSEWPYRSYQLEETLIRSLRVEARTLRRKWRRRIGSREHTDPLRSPPPGRRGYRGHGVDPDDPWSRHRRG